MAFLEASREQRASMVRHLRAFALKELADEIAVRDWTIRDAVAQGATLAKFDEEHAIALDKFDSAIFRRRFPDVFG